MLINQKYYDKTIASIKEAFYPLLVKINEQNLVPIEFQQIIKKEDYLFYQRTTICQLWDTE